MKKKYWILIAVAVVIAILVVVNIRARKGKGLPVQTEKVTPRSLAMVISASGNIQPKRQVDVSANAMGRITSIAVKEGDTVRKGQVLLQLDPVQLESAVNQLKASIQAVKANERQAYAQLQKAKSDLERTRKLFGQGYLTSQEVETAGTNYEVSVASHEAALHQIAQYEANLESAEHSLKEVTITATMDGVVTRLNVEEGENAVMGTMNIPGTVLLTIADLSTIEAEVEVDETEVVHISLGDSARVTLDAFPDTSYAGVVTEVGNSPILSTSVAGAQGIDFKVVITLTDEIDIVRPGLSADAEITVARRDSALSISIQSLTVRRQKDLKGSSPADTTELADDDEDIEGVFVVEGNRARFRHIEVGISSQKYFEVLSGLKQGDEVVSGNFKAIRELRDDQRVTVAKKRSGKS
ncbi:MAG TPA: efflux RND transporter periplasmic adaptor subunit [Patescibacteria group bacterium]|nr:efflux RND transporter periplasmic adaptor subunit [Patescibacteria group bacterium]